MFDYVFSAPSLPQISTGPSTVWSRLALSPLAPDLLTPFSYSTHAEIVRRGWYAYYDSLDAAPTPGAQLVRQHKGRAYLNLSISAALDAQLGLEPLALRINGQRQLLAPWTKPGLLSSLLNRSARKVTNLLDEMQRKVTAVTTQAQAWHHKTGDLRWTQAEILQVMEEIERVGVHSLRIFFAARHNLMLLYNRILWATQERAPFPENLAALQGALRTLPALGAEALIESQIAAAVAQLAAPDPQLDAFLEQYGHRALHEGEIRQPRWGEEARLIRTSARACAARAARSAPHQPTTAAAGESTLQPLLDAAGNRHKELRQWVEEMAHLMGLQSHALHAYAYVLAGTRRWALAAANEAMADGRLTSQDDVFFFELEQVKEMMTGEWNISAVAEIQAHAREQRARYAEWQQAEAAPLLLGDIESDPIADLPGCPGATTGPFFAVSVPNIETLEAAETAAAGAVADVPWEIATDAVLGLRPFDSGGSALLPVAKGLLGVGAAPLDPVVVAACIQGIPCVLRSGAREPSVANGAEIRLDGDRGATPV